jgi:DNA polymerase I-like protein with 3'-5' exonuclease and polymerase domains
MYRINDIFKAIKLWDKMLLKVHPQYVYDICKGKTKKIRPDIADDMIRVIREESALSIQHLETLKENWNEQ